MTAREQVDAAENAVAGLIADLEHLSVTQLLDIRERAAALLTQDDLAPADVVALTLSITVPAS